MKTVSIKGIVDISGFGKRTPYEKACQTMLQSGFEWLMMFSDIERKKILKEDSKKRKELSKIIVASVDNDCTGAMHDAVVWHLCYIAHYGFDQWKAEAKRQSK